MRWEDERYVRAYTKDTPDWLAMGWEAHALFWELLRKVDRAGLLDLGKSGVRGVSATTGIPLDVVERALPVLLNDGCVAMNGKVLIMPNYIDAQEARQSDKQRQRECRAKARDSAVSGHTVSQNVTGCDENGGGCHTDSKSVTPCLAVLSSLSLGSESISASDPDLTRARVATPVPSNAGEPHKRKYTGQQLLELFGRVRSQVWPEALPWSTARDSRGDSGTFAERLTPDEDSDVLETMRLACWHIRDGAEGWTDARLKDPSFAFGAWKAGFTALREELHGCAPKVRPPPARPGRGTGSVPDTW